MYVGVLRGCWYKEGLFVVGFVYMLVVGEWGPVGGARPDWGGSLRVSWVL